MPDVPYGHCHCGCGEKTALARQTITARGIVKGEPMHFRQFHHLKEAGKVRGEQKRVEAGIPDDAPRNELGHSCAELSCEVCGGPFLAQWSQRFRRRACSRRCAAVLKRKRMQARKGAKNPNYKNGSRVGVRDRAGEERWYAATVSSCQAPECPGGFDHRLALHHVCYSQHVVKAGGDKWDPRNSLVLCFACHTSHHRRGRVLPLSALRDENYTFARELLGLAAYDYLRRYYDGNDPRLDEFLADCGLVERAVPVGASASGEDR